MSESAGAGDSPSPSGGTQPTGLRVTLRALWRAGVIVWQFVPLVLAWARDRRRFLFFGRSRPVSSAERTRRARELKTTFIELGPAFIKLGQMLSTRPDALPEEYVEVLAELQDRVPPDDWTDIERVIESELGPIEQHFDAFETTPISGASLGQVYVAECGGETVAVKVLRPGIRERVESDLRVLGVLIPILTRGAPPGQAFTLENVAEEFAATIRREMDYDHEARMLQTVGRNFADRDDVVIPSVRETHSTGRLLTMTYVDGVKIDEVEQLDELDIDRREVVRRLEEVYIQMIVEDGVFHADPHPGNLAVQPDGTLVFYDFGMTGSLGPQTREQLMEFYIALAADDVERVMDAFVAMGAMDPHANREVMREAFEIAIEQFRGEDISQYRIEELVGQFEEQLYEFPMRLPQDLALVVRVTTVLEGVCRTLDPEFDFIDIITEYVMEEGAAEAGTAVREELTNTVRATSRALIRVPRGLETALDTASRDDLLVQVLMEDSGGLTTRMARRLLLGLVLSAGVPIVAFLYTRGTPVALWTAVALTTLAGGALLLSFRRQRGSRLSQPQFTRHELRQRRQTDPEE